MIVLGYQVQHHDTNLFKPVAQYSCIVGWLMGMHTSTTAVWYIPFYINYNWDEYDIILCMINCIKFWLEYLRDKR